MENRKTALLTSALIFLLISSSILFVFSTNIMPTIFVDEGDINWYDLIIADANNDGKKEIVVVGFYKDIAFLNIYDIDLNEEASIKVGDKRFYGVNVGDYDGDGDIEIIVCGTGWSVSEWFHYIGWYSWDGKTYKLEYEKLFTSEKPGALLKVSQPIDVDGDEVIEYVVVGYIGNLDSPAEGYVAHAEYSGSGISNIYILDVEKSINDLKVGHFDSDATQYEIIIAGRSEKDEGVVKVLRVLSPNAPPTEIASNYYAPPIKDVEAQYNALDVDKINSNGKYDIIAVGQFSGTGPAYFEFLRILEWDGSSLFLLANFYDLTAAEIGDMYYDVKIGDIDFDNTREMVIVGHGFQPPSVGVEVELAVCILSGSSIAWDSGSKNYYDDKSMGLYGEYRAVDVTGDIIVAAGNTGVIRLFDAHPESTTIYTTTTSTSIASSTTISSTTTTSTISSTLTISTSTLFTTTSTLSTTSTSTSSTTTTKTSTSTTISTTSTTSTSTTSTATTTISSISTTSTETSTSTTSTTTTSISTTYTTLTSTLSSTTSTTTTSVSTASTTTTEASTTSTTSTTTSTSTTSTTTAGTSTRSTTTTSTSTSSTTTTKTSTSTTISTTSTTSTSTNITSTSTHTTTTFTEMIKTKQTETIRIIKLLTSSIYTTISSAVEIPSISGISGYVLSFILGASIIGIPIPIFLIRFQKRQRLKLWLLKRDVDVSNIKMEGILLPLDEDTDISEVNNIIVRIKRV